MATVTERLRLRQHRSTFIAAIAVIAFVVYVVQESWAGRPITGDSLLFFVVVGVTLGSIYAVAAAGLVVTYTTSGIFNFAQGAMGMLLAFVYWELKINAGIQTFVALLLTVLVAAPLLGAFIERVFMRRLTTAPLVSQIVVTIGLMLFLIGLAATFWDPNETRSVGTFFGSDGFNIGETFVPYYRMITVVAGLLLALGIRLLLYRTRLGVAMRAVVDNRELAALNGARPGLTSQFSWMLGTSMAALAGIFLAEELSTLSIETLTLLIIDAFAAAIIGRLKSLPMTYVGGMIIGLSLSFQANFLTWSGRWSPAGQAIPTIILFLALLFLPQARIEGRRIGRGHHTAPADDQTRAVRLRGAPCHRLRAGRADLAARRANGGARARHRVHHALARALDRLVGPDLAGPDHLRRRRRVGGGRVRQRRWAGVRPRALLGGEPVAALGGRTRRGADRRAHGAPRACDCKASTSRLQRLPSRASRSSSSSTSQRSSAAPGAGSPTCRCSGRT